MERARNRALLGAMAAELGHELAGPLNLFRLTVERVERNETLDAEDAAALREELERLSRLSTRLRTLLRPSAGREVTSLQRLLELACAAAGVERNAAGFSVSAELRGDHSLACDRELLGLALGELVSNALEARRERAGLRVALGARSGFCVWDDGTGFPMPFAQALGWGISTRAGRTGLGLTLALRAARAHGFSLESHAEAGQTQVWLMIPGRELSPSAREKA